MRYVLSTGKLVEVFFNHQYHSDYVGPVLNPADRDYTESMILDDTNWTYKPYATKCEIHINNQKFEAFSECNPNDQFTKLKGRLNAFRKLVGSEVPTKETRKKYNLSKDYVFTGPVFHLLTKQEREELFKLIFPKIGRNTDHMRTKRYWSNMLNSLQLNKNQDVVDINNKNIWEKFKTFLGVR